MTPRQAILVTPFMNWTASRSSEFAKVTGRGPERNQNVSQVGSLTLYQNDYILTAREESLASRQELSFL